MKNLKEKTLKMEIKENFSIKRIKNIGYLYIVQLLNQIFPIFTMPLLIRNLGMSDYGILQFALAYSSYVYLVSDYGFALSAPKEIALNKKDIKLISNTYYNVQLLRLLLLSLCYLLVFIFFAVTKVFAIYENICLMMFFYTLGSILFPVWLFQGMEDLGYSSILTMACKTLQLILFFIYFKTGNSVKTVVLIYGMSNLAQALVAHLIVIKRYNIIFSAPKLVDLRYLLKTGWYMFISQSATSLFSSLNVIILGAISTPFYVGIFSTGEKLIRAAVNFVGPLSRAIYPASCQYFAQSEEDGITFIKKVAKYAIPLFSFGCLILLIFSNFISSIFTTENTNAVSIIIKILSPVPLLVLINNFAGTQIMLNLGLEKKFSLIVVITGVINILFAFILIPIFNANGMAIASLISEFFIMFATVIYVFKWRRLK